MAFQYVKKKFAPVSVQKEKIAFTQQFRDQTNAVFQHLENVFKMLNNVNKFPDDIINLTTDMLIDSINGFAGNCYLLHQNRNYDALDLGKKIVEDRFAKLSNNNKQKASNYYIFLISALNSSGKKIQINQERLLTDNEIKLQKIALSNPNNLNNGFSKVIKSGSNYDKKSGKYMNDDVNKQLYDDHNKILNDYRNNPKYKNNKKLKPQNINNGTNNFYFTKSGQSSQFVNNANIQNQNMMDNILMNDDDNDNSDIDNITDSDDDDINMSSNNNNNNNHKSKSKKRKSININGVIKLHRNNPLNNHFVPTPCEILSLPNNNQSKYHIRLAQPFRNEYYRILPNQFQIIYNNDNYVGEIEQKHQDYYNVALGYQSVNRLSNDL